MQNISQESILNMVVALPPIEEQISIVDHIETETGKIDYTISRIENRTDAGVPHGSDQRSGNGAGKSDMIV